MSPADFHSADQQLVEHSDCCNQLPNAASGCPRVQGQLWRMQRMPTLAQSMMLSPLNAIIRLPAVFPIAEILPVGAQACA